MLHMNDLISPSKPDVSRLASTLNGYQQRLEQLEALLQQRKREQHTTTARRHQTSPLSQSESDFAAGRVLQQSRNSNLIHSFSGGPSSMASIQAHDGSAETERSFMSSVRYIRAVPDAVALADADAAASRRIPNVESRRSDRKYGSVIEDDVQIKIEMIRLQEQQIASLEDELVRTKSRMSVYKEEINQLQERLQSQADEFSRLRRQKNSDKNHADDLLRLKMDNARLLRLLASSGAFSELVESSDVSSGGITFVPNPKGIQETSELEYFVSKYGKGRVSDVAAEIPIMQKHRDVESAFWVPREAYNIIKDFYESNNPEKAPFEVYLSLLHQLHSIWLIRERLIRARCRMLHAKEIEEMQRKIRNRIPYESVINTEKIQYLQRELLRVSKMADMEMKNTKGSKSSEPDSRLARQVLYETLDFVEDLLRQLREERQRNHELQLLQMHTRSSEFAEGVVWFGTHAVDELDKHTAEAIALIGDMRAIHQDLAALLGPSAHRFLDRFARNANALELSLSKARLKVRDLIEQVLNIEEQGAGEISVPALVDLSVSGSSTITEARRSKASSPFRASLRASAVSSRGNK